MVYVYYAIFMDNDLLDEYQIKFQGAWLTRRFYKYFPRV